MVLPFSPPATGTRRERERVEVVAETFRQKLAFFLMEMLEFGAVPKPLNIWMKKHLKTCKIFKNQMLWAHLCNHILEQHKNNPVF